MAACERCRKKIAVIYIVTQCLHGFYACSSAAINYISYSVSELYIVDMQYFQMFFIIGIILVKGMLNLLRESCVKNTHNLLC